MVRLNRTHSFLNLQTKFFNYVLYFDKISSELSKICSIHPHTPRMTQNLHQLLTHLYYIMFQAPALAENSQEFQRITQIPHNSPTASTNYAKFTPFVNPLYIMFQMPDQWQRTP